MQFVAMIRRQWMRVQKGLRLTRAYSRAHLNHHYHNLRVLPPATSGNVIKRLFKMGITVQNISAGDGKVILLGITLKWSYMSAVVIDISKGWGYEYFGMEGTAPGRADLLLDHVVCEYVGVLENGVVVSLTISGSSKNRLR
jgi:hypothetical protein